MKSEPLYKLPVEEPADTEGWSVVAGQTGERLAVAIAAEIERIEADIAAFEETIATLPRRMQAGFVQLPRTVFRTVSTSFYNFDYLRGTQAVIFNEPFDDPPAVVVLPNNTPEPGFPIECSASDVTRSGFTVRLAVSLDFTGSFVSRWFAAERTQ